jgi:seryl-tRNA synthetase
MSTSCSRCLSYAARRRAVITSSRGFHHTRRLRTHDTSPIAAWPPSAPKPILNIKHIRDHYELYAQNCLERNYKDQSSFPKRIRELWDEWQRAQQDVVQVRRDKKAAEAELRKSQGKDDSWASRAALLKEQTLEADREQAGIQREMQELAFAIPNLTSQETPRGSEPKLIGYINKHVDPDSKSHGASHVEIGRELGLLDFDGAGDVSGWGWYYLLGDAARLEHALVQYALSVASKYGWAQVSPPSMVYSHIATACGFQPRDQNGEQQIYGVDGREGKIPMVLAGTAEIPLAGMKAGQNMKEQDLPMKRVATSRCYRAEAGARGVKAKGLYRVHEFTKVEMFAWTRPDDESVTRIFEEMVGIQREILESLGLHCRVLEMPSTDLGASAFRKCDIEAYFPSRRASDDGFGEVTSASICTDYQTRRLATRVRLKSPDFPWTANGTAMAVPRVLAALLENGWNPAAKSVTLPECLAQWMGGRKTIQLDSESGRVAGSGNSGR